MLKPVYKDVEDFSCVDLYQHAINAPAGTKIWEASHEIAQLLIEKNISYGNSALEPINIFSHQNDIDSLKSRIDDKLSRVKNNQGYAGDNDIDDLIGYLVLLKIALDKDGHREV
jgi:hypothetical protein